MRKFIRIYVWIFIALAIFGLDTEIREQAFLPVLIWDMLSAIIAIACMFFLIYRVKVLPALFWKIFLLLILLDNLILCFFYNTETWMTPSIQANIAIYLANTVIIAPALIAVGVYAFKRDGWTDPMPGPETGTGSGGRGIMKIFLQLRVDWKMIGRFVFNLWGAIGWTVLLILLADWCWIRYFPRPCYVSIDENIEELQYVIGAVQKWSAVMLLWLVISMYRERKR